MKAKRRIICVLAIVFFSLIPIMAHADCKEYPMVLSVSLVGPCMQWCDANHYQPRTQENYPKAQACKDGCAQLLNELRGKGKLLRVNNN